MIYSKYFKILISKIITIAFIFCFMVNAFATGIKEPTIEAAAGILMDYETGRILWEKNSSEPLSMASTTKIMTAIVALENANMNDIVEVSNKAAHANPVKMNLQKGEKIKLKYLMYALMLQSSNDAAVAIAEHIGGSVEEFCKLMTVKAAELGAKDTVFETPNGLDAGNHHSTAYDLAIITRYALANDEFTKLINTDNVTVSSDKNTYAIYNKNRLLKEFNGANGVKTGFTGKAGHCFVGSAKRGDMQLISVVLASGWGQKGKEQKWLDTKEVLGYGFSSFEYVDVIKKDLEAGKIDVARSRIEDLQLYYGENLKIPLNPNERNSVYVKLEIPLETKAPIEVGQKIGTAKIILEGELYKEIDLITKEGASRFDIKTCAEDVLREFLNLGTSSDLEINIPEYDIFEKMELIK